LLGLDGRGARPYLILLAVEFDFDRFARLVGASCEAPLHDGVLCGLGQNGTATQDIGGLDFSGGGDGRDQADIAVKVHALGEFGILGNDAADDGPFTFRTGFLWVGRGGPKQDGSKDKDVRSLQLSPPQLQARPRASGNPPAASSARAGISAQAVLARRAQNAGFFSDIGRGVITLVWDVRIALRAFRAGIREGHRLPGCAGSKSFHRGGAEELAEGAEKAILPRLCRQQELSSRRARRTAYRRGAEELAEGAEKAI
jgi:hypothetical protein